MLNYNTYCIQTLPRSGYGFASATRQLSYGWKTLGVQTFTNIFTKWKDHGFRRIIFSILHVLHVNHILLNVIIITKHVICM